MNQDTRYYALQLCMLQRLLTDSLPLSSKVFLKDILPLIQMWVYIHQIVIDGIFRDDLPVDFTWCPVCNHTCLCDFLVHECSQTYQEDVKKSSNSEINTHGAPCSSSFLQAASVVLGLARPSEP